MQATPIVYRARLKVEATTALRVGSGKQGLLVDSLVAKDANDLPYIPGTSIAGVLRHELTQSDSYQKEVDKLFGFQEEVKKKGEQYPEGQGSRIIFSDAQLLADDNNKVHEGLEEIDFETTYYQKIKQLPERDHVRITHRGVAQDTGKYEEELVRKGTRFVFDIELHGTKADADAWKYLLAFIQDDAFRIGAGTRKGYGALEIVDYCERIYDLQQVADLKTYLEAGSSLNDDFGEWKKFEDTTTIKNRFTHYRIELTPENFFLFGAGTGDGDINALPKKERYIKWEGDTPTITEDHILMPATSVKGAISHRVAYHYNRLNAVHIEDAQSIDPAQLDLHFDANGEATQVGIGIDLEQLEDIDANDAQWERWLEQIDALDVNSIAAWRQFEDKVDSKQKTVSTALQAVGEQNEAVRVLFGYAKDNKDANDEIIGARGKVIFSDIYQHYNEDDQSKVFNHVAIDRFTGGGRDGALFQERVVTTPRFHLDIHVEKDALQDQNIKRAFEETLHDLATGNLQLGGHTTKGHGVFSGSWEVVS